MNILTIKAMTDHELEHAIRTLRGDIDRIREEMLTYQREISVRHEKIKYKMILDGLNDEEKLKLQQYIVETGRVASAEKVGTPGSR